MRTISILLIAAMTACSCTSKAGQTEEAGMKDQDKIADKPLFRDPVYDGAADPVLCFNRNEKKWFMFYTNRRANVPGTVGVSWVHGTPVGIAESSDGGATWKYRTTAKISYKKGKDTYWAPEVIEHNGTYHMYLTYVPGIFTDWNASRDILHLTSTNLLEWEYQSTLELSSDRVIDASVMQLPDRTWRMWYNNETDRKSIYYADSRDLYAWNDKGKAVGARGEGPKVFRWRGYIWMVVDVWNGLSVYRSKDASTWQLQKGNLLQGPGEGPDDQVKGGHPDVVVSGDRAYLFYFTHPGRRGPDANKDTYEQRRSSIQVVELTFKDGWLTCDRDKPTRISLQSPVTGVNPDASPEARALLNFIHAMYGKKTMSGQMWAPWGIDEIKTVQEITGKLPAIRGQDYIHERANKRENELAIEWWRSGGIPTIMWHWGAPSKGEGYNQSKMTIDIDRCFESGTPEHTAMWKDLERIADHLTELRDANVPILWRPMHEFDGGWFWYGKGGGERFIRLWRTMFDYFVKERKLNNLIWVLCHSGRPKADWNPGKDYYDLAGPDTYGKGIQESLFNTAKSIHGDTIPIPYHECGTIPDPDESFERSVTWSWWMLWHTGHLTGHDRDALIRAYNHELVLTRDELPNIMGFAGKALDNVRPSPDISNPLIEQRADPWCMRHADGNYYFTATVPQYDRIELRCANTIKGLAKAKPRVIWRKHERGPMSYHIWAPEIHHIDGKWYVYFAAGRAEDVWAIRMYVLECSGPDSMTGKWIEKGQLTTNWESFSLDATTFEHAGRRYLVWAQKDPAIRGNTNLYIALMDGPCSIKGKQVMITRPEYDWEKVGYWVNEGPAVLIRNGRIFISYSASATDHNYCMGLLTADESSDLLDPASWDKASAPVFKSSHDNSQYGPGHNSFTVTPDAKTDLLFYHARNYRDIQGNPLGNPDRHTRVQKLNWKQDGAPDFGEPLPDGPLP